MKTAGRGNANRWAAKLSNRANGAAGQNRSCSIKWAAKVEKFQPLDEFFFLTFPFIELTRRWLVAAWLQSLTEGFGSIVGANLPCHFARPGFVLLEAFVRRILSQV